MQEVVLNTANQKGSTSNHFDISSEHEKLLVFYVCKIITKLCVCV